MSIAKQPFNRAQADPIAVSQDVLRCASSEARDKLTNIVRTEPGETPQRWRLGQPYPRLVPLVEVLDSPQYLDHLPQRLSASSWFE